MVFVIVVDEVPVVDCELGRLLHPGINRAAGERLAYPGLERLAIHAERNLVVLPGEIIEAFADETAVDPEVLLAVLPHLSEFQGKARRGFRLEVDLKDERVVVVVAVGVHTLRENTAPRRVADVDAAEVSGFGEAGDVLRRDLDRFSAGEGRVIANAHLGQGHGDGGTRGRRLGVSPPREAEQNEDDA